MKDYFSHDYNARNDKKLTKLFMKHGLSGIGAYWCIIEMVYEEGGYLLRNEYERISFELRVDYEFIKTVIQDFELFIFDDDKFWSETALNRLKIRSEKSIKAKQSIEKRWNKYKRNTNVLQKKNDSNTNKVNESKVKESINTDFILPDVNFKEVVDEWVDYRIKLKKPYKTQKGIEMFFSELKKLSDNSPLYAKKIIDQSMGNEWQGIFRLKENNQSQQPSIKFNIPENDR